MMSVIVIKPKRYDTSYMDIDGSLESLQKLVGGYIEPCAPAELRERGIELLANEEGLLKGLEPNRNLYPFFLVGTLVAVGVGEDEFTGLSAEQMRYLVNWLHRLDQLNY